MKNTHAEIADIEYNKKRVEEREIEWERKYWEKKKRGLYVVVRFIICIICIVEPFTLVIIPSNSTFNYLAVFILL